MGKQLLIMRHAKSDWNDASLSDFNRTLNSRGLINAPVMGKRLKSKKFIPEIIIASPANRAITTCEIVIEQLGLAKESIQTDKNIYNADYKSLLKIVNQLDNSKKSAALFGHNNGITDLTVYLTDADIFNIPTSGMVLIEFPFDDWAMISKNTGLVLFFETIKELKADS
jgi:phosphohistidine phosphatase